MPASVTRFRSRKQQFSKDQADLLREQLSLFAEDHELPHDAVGKVLSAIDARTAAEKKWTFVMLSPHQNALVVQYLLKKSKRPKEAVALWAALFQVLRNDTGEICMTRSELAESLGFKVQNVSTIMTELVKFNAVIRRKEGRSVRYFMSPMVGTHLTGAARDKAQEEAGQLKLKLVSSQ